MANKEGTGQEETTEETEQGDVDGSVPELNFVDRQYDEQLKTAQVSRYQEMIRHSWRGVDHCCSSAQQEANSAFRIWFERVKRSNPEWMVISAGAKPTGPAHCRTTTSAPFPIGDGKRRCTGNLEMNGFVEYFTDSHA